MIIYNIHIAIDHYLLFTGGLNHISKFVVVFGETFDQNHEKKGDSKQIVFVGHEEKDTSKQVTLNYPQYFTCSHVISVSSSVRQSFVVVRLNGLKQEIETSVEAADVKHAVGRKGG